MMGKLTFREFWELPYEEKWRYLWKHQRAWPVMAFGALLAAAVFLGAVKTLGKTTAMAGITVNLALSEAGSAWLTEDYRSVQGITSPKEAVYLAGIRIELQSEAGDARENYYAIRSLTTLCNTQEVDYLILDQVGFEVMLTRNVYLDLTKVFSPEELEKLGSRVISMETEDSAAPIPVALDISDCPFIQENADAGSAVYFTFVSGSPRTEQCTELLNWLMAWS